MLRRTYGKNNRVLHTAKLSQGFKVVSPSRAWQGAGISTGRTKIGVSGSETRTAKLRLSKVKHNYEAEELRSFGGVLPASGFGSGTGGQEGVATKTTADASAIESDARMSHTKLTLPGFRQRIDPRVLEAFLCAA